MLSSGDVAQMFAAQQSAMAQQTAYAQSISPATSLGAWGSPSAAFQQMPGMPGMPGARVVSYAPGGFSSASYGGGNRVAGLAMSGMGAAAGFAGAGLGIASMMGAGPLAGVAGGLGLAFDPIGAGLAGFGKAGLLGAGMAALPAAVLGGTAAHTVGSFVRGGQQQMMIQQGLGQFGFINQNSRSGFGFNRDDAQAIGNQIRSLSHIPEMMTSVQELTSLLPKLKSMGVMQGVRDATEFSARFKDAVKTIRDVSKMLGTTMEEASEFFAHSRSVGFLGKQAQLQNVMNAKYTAAVTGMDMGQVMQMQTTGANMGTSMGISRKRATTAITNIAQSLGAASEKNPELNEILTNLTGIEGPGNMSAAAEQLTGLTAQLAKNTAPGRLSMFGLAKFDDKGQYAGIDKDLAEQYRTGQLSRHDLMRRVQGFSREQKAAVKFRGDSLAMDFSAMAGPGGIAQFWEDMLADKGYTSENMQGLYMRQHMGMSENQIDTFQALKGMGSAGQGKEEMERRQAMEVAIRERTDPKMMMKRIGTKIHASTFGHVEQAGSEVFNSIAKSMDEFWDDAVGRHVVTMSKEGAQKLAKAFSNGGNKKELFEMYRAAAGLDANGTGLGGVSGPSSFGRFAGHLIGGGAALAFGGPMGLALYGAGNALGTAFGGRDLVGDGLGTAVDVATRDLLKVVGGLGRTETSTGRNAAEEYTETLRKLGMEDNGQRTSAVDQELQGRWDSLAGRGRQRDMAVVRQDILNLVSSMDKDGTFSKAEQPRKLQMLEEAIRGKIGRSQATSHAYEGSEFEAMSGGGSLDSKDIGTRIKDLTLAGKTGDVDRIIQNLANSGDEGNAEKARLLRAVQKMTSEGGENVRNMDVATMLSSLAAGEGRVDRINLKRVAMLGGAKDFLNLEELSKQQKAAFDNLSSVFTSEGAAALRDKPAFRDAVKKALEGGSDGKVAKAIMSETPADAALALQAEGLDIKMEDIPALRSIYQKAKYGGVTGKSVGSALDIFERVQKATDYKMYKRGMVDLAGTLKGDSALANAMRDFAGYSGADEKKYDEKHAKVRAEIANLADEYANTTDEDKKKEILTKAGGLKDAVVDAARVKDRKSLIGKTGKQIAKMFGVEYDDIARSVGGMTPEGRLRSISEDQFKALRAAVAGKGLGEKIVGDGEKGVSAQEKAAQELLATLKDVRSTIDYNTTAILLNNSDSLGLNPGQQKYLKSKVASEVPQVDKDGNVVYASGSI